MSVIGSTRRVAIGFAAVAAIAALSTVAISGRYDFNLDGETVVVVIPFSEDGGSA